MPERLQKFLARAGVASRRHAEALITDGRVSVNNQVVKILGTKVEPGHDLVMVDGNLISLPESQSYYVFYKPPLVVTTLDDPQGRASIASYVSELDARVFPVGRLDYDAEGALLLTNDGELAHKLTHPSYQVPRTYLAKVKGVPSVETLDKLRAGVRLEDGMAKPENVHIFEKVEKNTWLQITVTEGRQHLIKRMCAAIGHPVVRLFRPSYAGVGVTGLGHGQLRPLSGGEVEELKAIAEGRAQPKKVEVRLPPRRHGHGAPNLPGGDPDDVIENESRQGGQRVPTRKNFGRSWDEVEADEGQQSEEFADSGRGGGFKKGSGSPEGGRSAAPRGGRGFSGRGASRGERSGGPRGGGERRGGPRDGGPRGGPRGGGERSGGGSRGEGTFNGRNGGASPRGERDFGERSGGRGFSGRGAGERSGGRGERSGGGRGERSFGERSGGGRSERGAGERSGGGRSERGAGERSGGGRSGRGAGERSSGRGASSFGGRPGGAGSRGERGLSTRGGFGARSEGGRSGPGSKSESGKPFRAGKPAFGGRPGGGTGRVVSGPKRPGGPKRGR
ncbi:MAG: pseudouridine synthase [Myxococcaceae bacterium]